MKNLNYFVRKEKGGQYYVAYRTSPFPIAGSYGDKKHALKFAARLERMPLKDYMKARKDIESGQT